MQYAILFALIFCNGKIIAQHDTIAYDSVFIYTSDQIEFEDGKWELTKDQQNKVKSFANILNTYKGSYCIFSSDYYNRSPDSIKDKRTRIIQEQILRLVDSNNVVFHNSEENMQYQNIFASSPDAEQMSLSQRTVNITINHVLIYRVGNSIPFSGYLENVRKDGSKSYTQVINGVQIMRQ